MVARRLGLVALLMLPVACSRDAGVPPAATSGPQPACAAGGCWQQVLPPGNGGFPPAPGSQNRPLWEPGRFPLTLTPHVAFGGELWMVAQQHAYSSPDGLTWTQHDKADWGERIYSAVAYFRGRLWMYGGMDYRTGAFLDDIWSSADGSSWSEVGRAAWSGRGGHALVVHRDRLWLLGGADHAGEDRSPDRFLNDVWVSEDGLEWEQVTGAAPWSPRHGAGAVVLGGALYVVGGEGRADVWRSDDGRDWTRLVAEAGWKPRSGYARVAFDGKLWVFGGWTGTSTNARNDIWHSSDGASWTRQTDHAPWAPRSPVAVVFGDRIWIFSGKHTGADDNWGGDLWQMTAGTGRDP
ncbi:MAG: hypothetical protein ACT4PX_01880 [Actinomycetota bacterium]